MGIEKFMNKNILYILCISLFLQMNTANAGSTGSEDLSKSQGTTPECFEGVSRAMFKLNHGLDKVIFEPVAKGYRALPTPMPYPAARHSGDRMEGRTPRSTTKASNLAKWAASCAAISANSGALGWSFRTTICPEYISLAPSSPA